MVKEDLWESYFKGKTNGKCFCCKDKITSHHFEAGHVKAEVKGEKLNIENLRPICRKCNSNMGTMNLNKFKKNFLSHK